ncbi:MULTISPECIES: hypothetical protein [unclassified Streptococcus]|uniref:hypothetical protein n=1 Tax=unclassified Streptococcus TaxID=2608887 RepID=UPI0015669B29|nr:MULTISPECIES: hypothetical protein [unclassified Streptococcus]
MITVKKENRVLDIDELEKATFLEDGYDVVKIKDGEYVVVEPATSGRTYTIQEYQAVVAERDQALAELEKVKAKKTSKKDEEEK